MPEIILGLIAGIAVFGGVLALGRLLAASPRATLAGVIGVAVGLIALIARWPGLLLADVAVMLAARLANRCVAPPHAIRRQRSAGLADTNTCRSDQLAPRGV